MRIIMSEDQVNRTLKRMAHEIIERTPSLDEVVLVGIKSKGTPIAREIQKNLRLFEGTEVPLVEVDISGYRDDEKRNESAVNVFDVSLQGKVIILVDDVLFTGRSARAAMDACMDMGRASKIQLAVLIDRGHRELPIRPDYVGKNIPTNINEKVVVDFSVREVTIK